MTFNIPEIGFEFTVKEDWTFSLFPEYRNDSYIQYLGAENTGSYTRPTIRAKGSTVNETSLKTTIQAGSVMRVDRIYIRKGAADYSSITFYLTIPGQKKKLRFWAKLEDVNTLAYEPITT